MQNIKVIFSTSAYRSILDETFSHNEIETGGIFLGHFENSTWYVIEVIDPGYEKVTREYAYFEYDKVYVEHLANIRAKEYKQSLSLIGLWHRHPGSMDTFSSTDDGTNTKFALQNSYGVISSLVNIDPNFRLTVYSVPNKSNFLNKVKYNKIENVLYGDEFIPVRLLEKESINMYLQKTLKQEVIFEKKMQYNESESENENENLELALQNILLDVVDVELDYLENQHAYSYTIEPIDLNTNSLEIGLKSNRDSNQLIFKLTLDKTKNIYCSIIKNDKFLQEKKYTPHSIKTFLSSEEVIHV